MNHAPQCHDKKVESRDANPSSHLKGGEEEIFQPYIHNNSPTCLTALAATYTLTLRKTYAL